jgi:long-subunit fatty acid transport protein
MDSYDIVKVSDTKSLNGNISYSFTQGRGFTIPFTGKKIHISNQLSTSLGIAYENNEDVTKGRENSQVDRSTSRLAFTPGATYQFDQNIKGGLTSSYEVTTDRKRDDGSSIFSLGVWVEVNL